MNWMTLITENSEQITLIIAIFAGLFAFIKWLDTRNRALKNERYKEYLSLISVLAGSSAGKSVGVTEQIASVWLLLEYKEYYQITLKILRNEQLKDLSNDTWLQVIPPEMDLVASEIEKRT